MAVEWAGSGPELLLAIDRAAGTGLRAQLEEQLRAAIRTGRLGPGDKLPSSRELARALGLSRGLVQDCYAQLQAEGYLTSSAGSATRVARGAATTAVVPTATTAVVPATNTAVVPATTTAVVSAPTTDVVPAARPAIADFRTGVPDLGLIPREDWAWAVREACRTLPDAAFDYGDPAGRPRLRATLAAYLTRVRAAAATADHIVVSAGMAQALALVLHTLSTMHLDALALEDPGPGATTEEQAERFGLRAVPIPVDEEGIDPTALHRSGVRAVLVTPAHQWPTGVVLSGPRRQALIAWARACDGLIIEDDYDAEFRYDRDPVGSLQGLAPDCVISLGTVSKSLAPALRLGWIIAPTRLLAPLTKAKQLADRGGPAIDQEALAILMESGRYDRHLRRMRTEYSTRRETLLAALAKHAPGAPVTGPAAGLHAVLHLEPGTDEAALIAAARTRGVGVYSIDGQHRASTGRRPRLVLGFGDTPPRAIEAGIAAIADLLNPARAEQGKRAAGKQDRAEQGKRAAGKQDHAEQGKRAAGKQDHAEQGKRAAGKRGRA